VKALPIAILLCLAAAPAFAGTPIDETRAVSPDARIDISNIKGTVSVTAWDKPEVAITGTLGDGAKRLAVEGGGAHLSVKVEPPDRQGWLSWGADTRMGDSMLDLKVPKNAELKIDVVSADVSVGGTAGRTLAVNSVSGKLRLESTAKDLDIDSVSGNIELTGASDRAHLQTVSGDIRARGLGGEAKFETVSGDIDAEAGRYHELGAGTVSGDITLRGAPEGDARIDVTTMSGDVHLHLPADASLRLRASSFSGSIRSDFGSVKEPEHGPGSSLDATAGSGAGSAKIETFSGDIEIVRQ